MIFAKGQKVRVNGVQKDSWVLGEILSVNDNDTSITVKVRDHLQVVNWDGTGGSIPKFYQGDSILSVSSWQLEPVVDIPT